MSNELQTPVIEEEWLRLAEALVFASSIPVNARMLGQLLPEAADVEAVIAALRTRYISRGVELVDAAGGVMFRTAPDLAPKLRKVVEIPRRLPRAAMETLAIIAYHQPITRPEIEQIRGASLSQQTLDALLEAGVIAPKGRRESPGRPTLWGTTPAFLTHFGLRDLRDLPSREELLVEPASSIPLREGDEGMGSENKNEELETIGSPSASPPLDPLPQGEGECGPGDKNGAPETTGSDRAPSPPNPLPQWEGEC
jgi:segregation and condensation protein B